MTEIDQLQQQNHRTFVLVVINFVMFLVLFFGLGYVAWRSSTLISKLETDLEKVERAVVQFQNRIQDMDFDALMSKVIGSTKENIANSMKTALKESEFSTSVGKLAQKVENAQDKLERIGEAVGEANDKLRKIDTEQLAQAVSYHMLKGLGDGFTNAAEARKPLSDVQEKDKSSVTQ